MQASLQHYISNSISSTINLPAEITVEEIENIYLNAWESKLKGITYIQGRNQAIPAHDHSKKEKSS